MSENRRTNTEIEQWEYRLWSRNSRVMLDIIV